MSRRKIPILRKHKKLSEAGEFGNKEEIHDRIRSQVRSYQIDSCRRKKQLQNVPETARLALSILGWCNSHALGAFFSHLNRQ